MFALQSLTDFELFLCLNYLHLIEKLCNFCLAAIDAIEELVLLFKDCLKSLTNDGKFIYSRY